MTDAVRLIAKKLAKEYHIDIDPAESGVIGTSYAGPHTTPREKIQSFINMLDKLEKGKTYLFVDHPGLDSPELRSIHHIGYEAVAADRQGVTDLWTSEAVKKAIKNKQIKLISYKHLLNK